MAENRYRARIRRKRRVRRRLSGTAERPRLCVFRSEHHIYAQIVDDQAGRTLVAASTRDPELRTAGSGATVAAAAKVGALIAGRAQGKSISRVVFDRGGYLYHGRVKAVADAAREKGLAF